MTPPAPRRLTLRLRFALWSGGLLLLFSSGLVLFINIAASITYAQTRGIILPVTPRPPAVPGQPAPTVAPLGSARPPSVGAAPLPLPPPVISRTEQTQLRQLRGISLVGLGIVAVLGGIGAYLLAGLALRPVRAVSRTAQGINAQTLATRLALGGPRDELTELADAFDVMLGRLDYAFAQQGRFVADAAHELRTPLATLRTNLEVVAADPAATLADYRDMSATLDRHLTRLERLVADLLLLAREEPLIVGEVVALGPLLGGVCDELRPLAAERQVTLHRDGERDLRVPGDAVLLARAMSNLVENGVRYNRPGGAVTVALHRAGEGTVVTVADTGIGIAPGDRERIFERFVRLDPSRARHTGGAGLGLSIVAAVIARHGGTVRVESIPGTGSTFTVWLPG